uniref:G protein-coupled receptor n=1 Tax=Syphacia muris TaxID=451379 RepID=A0A0N5ANT5_9BILA
MAVWQQVVKMVDSFAFLSLSIDRLTLFSNPRFYHNYITKLQRVIEICGFAMAITIVMWSVYETSIAPAYMVSCFCEIRRNMQVKKQAGLYNGLQEYFEADVSYTRTVILSALITYSFVLTLIIFSEVEFMASTVNHIGTQYYALFTTQINGMNIVGLSVWRQVDLRKSFTNLISCRRLKRHIASVPHCRNCIRC